MDQKIYLKDGTLFANSFNRVVHGGRGDYVEFEESDILLPLEYKFGTPTTALEHYYNWMIPVGHPETKVYWQLKTVKYADYKVGKFYVSPALFKDFKDQEALFSYEEL